MSRVIIFLLLKIINFAVDRSRQIVKKSRNFQNFDFFGFFGRFGSLHDYRSVFNFVKFTDFDASGPDFRIPEIILGPA